MSDEKRWAWWFVDGESMDKAAGGGWRALWSLIPRKPGREPSMLFGMAHSPRMGVRLACHPTPTRRPSSAPVRPCPCGQLGVCHAACRHGWLWGGGDEMSVTVTVPFACLATPIPAGLQPMPKVPNPARPLFSPVVCRASSARVCPSRAMSDCRVKVVFCTTQEIFAKTPVSQGEASSPAVLISVKRQICVVQTRGAAVPVPRIGGLHRVIQV